MALSYPLPVAEFQDRFGVVTSRFFISNPRDLSRTAGGTQISASLGDAVWRGSFSLPFTNDRGDAARIDALLSVLDRAGASALFYDRTKPWPTMDPGGVLLGAATPVISGLASTDARSVALSGLPPGYQLTGGDLIGWQYGTNPLRYALHRVVSDVSASAVGVTSVFEVTPFIQPGAAIGIPVQLIRPVIKAVIEPGPDYGMHRAGRAEGKQFSFVQTLR